MPTTDNIIPEEGAQPDITTEDNAQRGIPKEIIKINAKKIDFKKTLEVTGLKARQ